MANGLPVALQHMIRADTLELAETETEDSDDAEIEPKPVSSYVWLYNLLNIVWKCTMN